MGAPRQLEALAKSLLGASDWCQVDGFGDQPCWSIHIPGAQTLDLWSAFRDCASETHSWPVIIGCYYGPDYGGSDATVAALKESASDIRAMADPALDFARLKKTPEETIAEADRLPFAEWAARKHSKQFVIDEYLRKAKYFSGLDGASSMADHYRWAANQAKDLPEWHFDAEEYDVPPKHNRNPPQHELHTVKFFDSKAGKEQLADSVTLLLVPTDRSWEVPAYLYYSTYDHDYPPQVHVAALRYLFENFGAELVSIGERVLEVIPKSRPTDAIEALNFAAQLRAYSSCTVTSQNELARVDELAFFLMESEYWSFCWP